MSVASLRLFIAIDLNEDVRRELDRLSNELARVIPNRAVNWIPSDNFHLTVKFLGNTSPHLLEPIARKLNQVAHATSEFDMSLQSIGVFPNFARARVLWIGIPDPTSQLATLAKSLDFELSELGFVPESRVYVPHLTIAKLRQTPRNLEQVLEPYFTRSFGQVEVDRLRLYQSTVSSKGSTYELLREFSLKIKS